MQGFNLCNFSSISSDFSRKNLTFSPAKNNNDFTQKTKISQFPPKTENFSQESFSQCENGDFGSKFGDFGSKFGDFGSKFGDLGSKLVKIVQEKERKLKFQRENGENVGN
jgi:hypothetical protein